MVRLRTPMICCALLLFSTAAVGSELSASAGGAAAIPTGQGGSRLGAVLRVGLGWDLGIAHQLGVRAEAGIFDRTGSSAHQSAKLLGSYRYTFETASDFQPFLRGSAGVGLWSGCVWGDSCGGFGPSLAAEVGSRLRLSDPISLAMSLELGSQIGMVNRVGVMLMPAIYLGLGF